MGYSDSRIVHRLYHYGNGKIASSDIEFCPGKTTSQGLTVPSIIHSRFSKNSGEQKQFHDVTLRLRVGHGEVTWLHYSELSRCIRKHFKGDHSMVEREQISDAVFSGNNTQPDSFADYRMAGGMALTPTERSVQTSQDYLDTSLDFPLANNSQKKTDVAQAQDPSGERARELPTDPEVQKANGFATFLSSNMSRKPSDRDLNDRTAEWLRNRFEEDMAGGGKPEQLQAKMNEALASSGLQVTFRPNAPGSSYYRESAIEIRDTTRTQNDLFGRPIHPVIGAANGAGMNLPRSRN